jgi:hypothetical protein
VIQRLIAKQPWQSDIFNVTGIPGGAVPLCGRSLTVLTSQKVQGDVDVLLRDPERPELAVAIEAKRVKVTPGPKGQPPKINKLHEFQKAVSQANQLAKLGFSQVYLYVFVMIDSREANIEAHGARTTYDDALTPEDRRMLDEVISEQNLDPRVGLMRFDVAQPMDHEPLDVGTSTGVLLRSARPQTQPDKVTEWVASLPEEA